MDPHRSIASLVLNRSGDQRTARNVLRSSRQVEAWHTLVELQVNLLLDELAAENFDLISDRVIQWANKSEQENDGATLMQVVKLICEKAKGEVESSEVYARLCRKMMEGVSPSVQDETLRNTDGQPIGGGLLFRRYLLDRCQGDFERASSAKQAPVLAASEGGNGVASGCGAGAKAGSLGLGLMRFIGELFKLQMLTERIMHECIKKLLSNVINPTEEEIEGLCELLWTIGRDLDNAKARIHMDIYFERMQEISGRSDVGSYVQHSLQIRMSVSSAYDTGKHDQVWVLHRPPPLRVNGTTWGARREH
ncbi:hypothetical protein FRC08_011838 [Ceratobasidium sp. 394]|nr:hypothetical protein FRC08_011838 [Ceratobasidium sp. 394]